MSCKILNIMKRRFKFQNINLLGQYLSVFGFECVKLILPLLLVPVYGRNAGNNNQNFLLIFFNFPTRSPAHSNTIAVTEG
jgi:hypothetical protein